MSSPALEESAGLAAVRAWCGWHIAPSKTETVKVEGDGGRVLLLPSLHVTDVTEVRDEDAGAVTSYKWRENGVMRGWWRCENLYAVDITHGYDEMPAELVEVIALLDADGIGTRQVAAETRGPFSRSYVTATDLDSQPLSIRSIIGRYALPPRP